MKKKFWILIALAISAGSALIYEIVVTDILFFYFIESSYSLATVLSVFLTGLGLGSFAIFMFQPKIKNKKMLFGILQVFVAIYAIVVLTNMESIINQLSTLGLFASSFALLLVPTMFLGAIFPLSISIFDKKDSAGLVYSSDLLGAIIGVLIAGFVLVPMYGAKATILFGAGLNFCSAIIVLPNKKKYIPTLIIPIMIISLIFPFAEAKPTEFSSPSPYGLITIERNILSIDGREQCGRDYTYDTSEKLMVNYALDPLELDRPKVLNIGLGCGLTIDRALEFNSKVDVVEINPVVVKANKIISDVLKERNVKLIMNDGISYLRESNKKYDSILIDIENPGVAHSSNIYTIEAFELIKEDLVEGGTFSLWNYVALGNQEFADVLYYSLKESFDYVYKYSGVFIATDKNLNKGEYKPLTPYQINSIEHKVLQKYLN